MNFKISENNEFRELNTDREIIEQNKQEWIKLEQNLLDLKDSMDFIKEYILIEGVQIEKIDINVAETRQNTESSIDNLNEITILKKNHNSKIIKIVIGSIICGTLFGGVGACFGILPALGGTCIGCGTGSIIGNFYQ